MPKNLITLDEYKAYKGLTNPTQDATISTLITSVSKLVKKYCECSFVDYVQDEKIEHFNGGTEFLILKETPIIEILSIEYSTDYGNTSVELTEDVDWTLYTDYVYSTLATGFKKQLKGYQVTYLAGYEELPEDLKLACFDLVTYYLQNDGAVHSTKAPGTNSVQIEYISTTSLPAHIRRVLDLYKSDFA